MKKLITIWAIVGIMLSVSGVASANSIASSTMWFRGTLTETGSGGFIGILPMIDESVWGVGDGEAGFDIYAKEGATAWFGDDPGSGEVWTPQTISSDHDAFFPNPLWDPDTPDWYQYSLNFYFDGSTFKWALQNHPGATEEHPWYDIGHWGSEKLAMGIPMSGMMDWENMIATETDVGAYLPGTGTAEIPGGAASYGGGAGYWDMDWSWGSEVVPLQYSAFAVDITLLNTGEYEVSLKPAVPEPSTMLLLGSGLLGLAVLGRKKFLRK